MLRIALLLSALWFSLSANAQNVIGDWSGILKVQATSLPLVFHIHQIEGVLKATMDSPEQKAFDLPVAKTSFENDSLLMILPSMKIVYKGKVSEKEIAGVFRQNGQEISLTLIKGVAKQRVFNRPQEPKQPFDYRTEDITFTNEKAQVTLAGTLSLPKSKGPYPAVILVTGSGAQNRDEALLHHKPFLLIADYLTKNGIAVLRYDDRGVGKSTGLFRTATSADFAEDAAAALTYLIGRKEIAKKKIGILGHSEGGLIAPMVAAAHPEVSFIILLAGPGVRGDKLLLDQQRRIARVMGTSEEEIEKSGKINAGLFDLVQQEIENDSLKAKLSSYLKEALRQESNTSAEKPQPNTDGEIAQQLATILNPWMLYFLRYDPAPILQMVKCPVLAINGSNDLQVTPKENLEGIRKNLAIGGNKQVKIMELQGLNHLFQESKTGSPEEYETIEQTMAPVVLSEITAWIKQTVSF